MKHHVTARIQVNQRTDADGPRPRHERTAGEVANERAVPLRLLRFPALRERTGLSRSTIWRLERRGAFPRHRRISPNTVAWVEEEVNVWIRERAEAP